MSKTRNVMVVKGSVSLANQIWIALARLTRRDPHRRSFSDAEVKTEVEIVFGELASGIDACLSRNCVANTKPHGKGTRMIVKVGDGENALYRPGDDYHEGRENEPWLPQRSEIPPLFHELLDWYDTEYIRPLNEFGPEFLEIGPWDSGLHDVSERHDYYLSLPWREEQQES